ncbi:MAG: hypothetical protein ACRD6W_01220 [Nitrososphaerales archaeon]
MDTIKVALSNDSVRALMVGPPYYVDVVFPSRGGLNESNVIQMFQVNGLREINAQNNAADTAVISAGTANRVDVECFASPNACLTVPWGVNPDDGSSLAPFSIEVTYSGTWSLTVIGSDNPYQVSPPLAYNMTFTGTGTMTIYVPWFSDTGAASLTATAKKTDGGSATLSLTVNWDVTASNPGDPTSRSTPPGVNTATVSNYTVEA